MFQKSGWLRGLQLGERLHYKFEIGKIRQQRVGIARENVFKTVEAARADSERAGAEVFGAFDVVWCVADNDKLFGRDIELQVFANAVSRQRGKVAAIVRLVTEGSGQVEKFGETDKLQLQVCCRLDVAGEQSRVIARMIGHGLKRLTHAGQKLEKLFTVSSRFAHCFHVAFAEMIDALEDMFVCEAFVS
jgi:hypothetical protein